MRIGRIPLLLISVTINITVCINSIRIDSTIMIMIILINATLMTETMMLIPIPRSTQTILRNVVPICAHIIMTPMTEIMVMIWI